MKTICQTRLLLSLLGLFLMLFSLAPASAASANISHSYNADETISNGSLVSLDKGRTGYVKLANTGNSSQLIGVAVKADDSLLAVDETAGKVQVATSGTATVLVSTLYGNIKVGDQIAVSPFNGIGAKGAPGTYVVGLAQTDFNASSQGVDKQQVTDTDGDSKEISVGYLQVAIAPGKYSGGDSNEGLNGLQRFTKSVTGKTVSVVRIVFSIVIAIVAFTTIITIVYGAIYTGIISVGRNPLAKYAVMRTVTSAVAIAGIIALIALATIYFLLQ
jgi:hypothetical protein